VRVTQPFSVAAGSITDAMVAPAAAIAYSKLALAGSIGDADVQALGRLARITASGNFTVQKTGAHLVILVGGGAGGGGGGGSGAGSAFGGVGGGAGTSGEYSVTVQNLVALDVHAVTIGAAGVGGTGNSGAAGNNGTAGGDSVFGVLDTASGGLGGNVGTANGAPAVDGQMGQSAANSRGGGITAGGGAGSPGQNATSSTTLGAGGAGGAGAGAGTGAQPGGAGANGQAGYCVVIW